MFKLLIQWSETGIGTRFFWLALPGMGMGQCGLTYGETFTIQIPVPGLTSYKCRDSVGVSVQALSHYPYRSMKMSPNANIRTQVPWDFSPVAHPLVHHWTLNKTVDVG